MKRAVAFPWQKLMAFLLLLVGGLAVSRVLFELFFPRLLWLGRPFSTILFALTVALSSLPLTLILQRARIGIRRYIFGYRCF